MPDILGDISFTWPFWLGALLAYLVGSIPFGLLLTRMAGLGDIRSIGSGNIGATNVLRTGRKGVALATLILDGAKGTLAVVVAARYGPDMGVIAAAAAIVGHCFPIWLKFKGGKGVATGLGILLGLDVFTGLAACATWLLVAFAFRISSLAALCAYAASPAYAYWLIDTQHMELAVFLFGLIALRHAENIKRLLTGQESRISFSKKETPPSDPPADETAASTEPKT